MQKDKEIKMAERRRNTKKEFNLRLQRGWARLPVVILHNYFGKQPVFCEDVASMPCLAASSSSRLMARQLVITCLPATSFTQIAQAWNWLQ